MGAIEDWRKALASWALPEEILAKAPESPWSYPWEIFLRRAEAALSAPRLPSAERALEALPDGGSIIDVGSGPGAAALALAHRAGRLIAVDQSEKMLSVFDELAARVGVERATIVGTWPDVAGEVEEADVVVCHHVFYNAAELEPFVRALTDHANRRVVVEMTAEHPRAEDNHLWMQLHGLERPTRPTADDAERALREMGIEPRREDWFSPRVPAPREEIIRTLLTELALTPDRESDLVDALGDRLIERNGEWLLGPAERHLVTLWWDVSR